MNFSSCCYYYHHCAGTVRDILELKDCKYFDVWSLGKKKKKEIYYGRMLDVDGETTGTVIGRMSLLS